MMALRRVPVRPANADCELRSILPSCSHSSPCQRKSLTGQLTRLRSWSQCSCRANTIMAHRPLPPMYEASRRLPRIFARDHHDGCHRPLRPVTSPTSCGVRALPGGVKVQHRHDRSSQQLPLFVGRPCFRGLAHGTSVEGSPHRVSRFEAVWPRAAAVGNEMVQDMHPIATRQDFARTGMGAGCPWARDIPCSQA